MKFKFLFTLLIPFAFTANIFAQQEAKPNVTATPEKTSVEEVTDPDLLKLGISEIEVTTSTSDDRNPYYKSITPSPLWKERSKGGVAAKLIVLEEIVNLTAKAWQLIKDNAPVVNMSNSYATAVPNMPKSWTELTNWEGYRTFSKKKKHKGYVYGLIEMNYSLRFQYGGSYEGIGKYITGATIEVHHLYVRGYDFNVQVTVPDNSVMNIAEHGKPPIAAMLLQITYSIDGKTIKALTDTFAINGKGEVKELSEQAHISEAF